MRLVLTLMLLQFLFEAEGIQYSRSSNLLDTYMCLEEINVTYIAPSLPEWFNKLILEFLTALEDPCIKISFFDHNLRKVVEWKGEQSYLESIETLPRKMLDDVEFQEVIEILHDKKFKEGSNARQIFLFDHSFHVGGPVDYKMEKSIKLLENQTEWNVILLCSFRNCPVTTQLPIQRIVRGWGYRSIRKRVKDLVLNPDFNKFEFLKYVEIYDKNLTCLANKTVHIFIDLDNLENDGVMEIIALINYNTQKKDKIKFIIYVQQHLYDKFIPYSMGKNGLDDFNISIVYMSFYWTFPTFTGDGVFFINPNFVDGSLFEKYSGSNRNSVVMFKSGKSPGDISAKSWYANQKDFRKTVQKISFKSYDSAVDFEENFLEELLNASCY